MPKKMLLLVCGLLLAVSPLAAQQPTVRVSAWYWLNSAPENEWSRDFVAMKKLGFTDVLMCWGVDLSGVVTRKHDTLEAMAEANKAGLGTFLIVWQPVANSLPRDPKFMQITAEGKVLRSFDVFNPEWRNTQWKQYLQDVSRTYRNVPGFRGYAFDDTFGGSAAISYGPWEQKTFGAPLPRKPSDARWDDWVKARNQWWEDWAIDTTSFIRAIDPDPAHVIYVEDSLGSLTNPTRPALLGWNLDRTMKHFDAISGYTVSTWNDTTTPEGVGKKNGEAIEMIRKAVPDKPVIFTFWTANQREEMLPGPAVHPTAKEIIAICQEALRLGVTHLDMYGYRIGEYRVTKEQMADQMPAEPAPYKVTGQFPQKFMWDRPEIHDELGKYLRSLNK